MIEDYQGLTFFMPSKDFFNRSVYVVSFQYFYAGIFFEFPSLPRGIYGKRGTDNVNIFVLFSTLFV